MILGTHAICGISAPSCASTLINYVGLDSAIIWYIAAELTPKLRAKGLKGKLITPLPTPSFL